MTTESWENIVSEAPRSNRACEACFQGWLTAYTDGHRLISPDVLRKKGDIPFAESAIPCDCSAGMPLWEFVCKKYPTKTFRGIYKAKEIIAKAKLQKKALDEYYVEYAKLEDEHKGLADKMVKAQKQRVIKEEIQEKKGLLFGMDNPNQNTEDLKEWRV